MKTCGRHNREMNQRPFASDQEFREERPRSSSSAAGLDRLIERFESWT